MEVQRELARIHGKLRVLSRHMNTWLYSIRCYAFSVAQEDATFCKRTELMTKTFDKSSINCNDPHRAYGWPHPILSNDTPYTFYHFVYLILSESGSTFVWCLDCMTGLYCIPISSR
uniref:AlNc14C29G2747 protein n=1 Tax=Albugo laibachii Nc14 TaxID=890382 RepID=F0W7C7_9STRA|nr:AlNc14C29G2747 [Albugo laibachii Nc14]|eukprot:CCA17026.1 AlNc14C29G2747 [Albugo laibachii Nc14]